MSRNKISSFLSVLMLILFGLGQTHSQSFNNADSIKNNTVNKKNVLKSKGLNSDSVRYDSLGSKIKELLKKNLLLTSSLDSSVVKSEQMKSTIKNYETNTTLGSIVFSAAFLGLGISLYYSRKHSKSLKEDLKNNNLHSGKILEELKEEKENNNTFESKINKYINENRELKSKLDNIYSVKKVDKVDFFCQILLSAGPRKTSRDTELGEDTAGFCISKDHAYFWILDGTSDLPVVTIGRKEFMSSRLLAQYLSVNLQKEISSINGNFNSRSWLENSIVNTEAQWKQIVAELSDENKKILIEELAQRNGMTDVSTTALVGIINKEGKASIARIGDSKIFCLDQNASPIEDKLAQKPPSDSYGRLFARATQDGDSVSIDFNNTQESLRVQESTVNNVKTVLAFSDGIGPITENFLREHFNKFPIEDVQQRIVSIPQQTYDDKSLIMIQIRP